MFKDLLRLQFIPCHRKKERSLVIGNFQFPLCYRCMFILIGYLWIPILFWYKIDIPLYIGMLLHIPMFVDGVTQAKKLRLSTNFLRITTGFLAGFGQAIIIRSPVLFLVNVITTA
ncbi:DUF2085 domain-containing protein [Bacillus litorisediminis]|uniref:DUF2085 domain-containing protein n=1 Tax=Bacillus litorisediminis TaxID=2922713 RepID=UPI0036F2C648